MQTHVRIITLFFSPHSVKPLVCAWARDWAANLNNNYLSLFVCFLIKAEQVIYIVNSLCGETPLFLPLLRVCLFMTRVISLSSDFSPFLVGQKRSEAEMEDGKVDLYGCCSPYSTYSLQYTEKAYDCLVQLAEYNILNNEDLIIQALRTAVARKRQMKK